MPHPRRRPPPWNQATPDEELVAWAQGGHGEAFGVLYDRYLGPVYGYCYRCLGGREAAQDAAAETFRKALAALPAYRARAFRSWLFAIAHNVAADALRGARPHLPLEAAADACDAAPSPEDVALSRAEFDSIAALLPRLTADQRHAVALRLSGLSPGEIGGVLGKSRAATDMTLHRALLRLRELLTADPRLVQGGGRGG